LFRSVFEFGYGFQVKLKFRVQDCVVPFLTHLAISPSESRIQLVVVEIKHIDETDTLCHESPRSQPEYFPEARGELCAGGDDAELQEVSEGVLPLRLNYGCGVLCVPQSPSHRISKMTIALLLLSSGILQNQPSWKIHHLDESFTTLRSRSSRPRRSKPLGLVVSFTNRHAI
jgi:hypothetical protein